MWRTPVGQWTDDEVGTDPAHCPKAAAPCRRRGGARREGDARAHGGVSRRGRTHRSPGVRQLLAALPSWAGRAQPQDRGTGSASLEVRPSLQAWQGASRARRSADLRSARGLGQQGMTSWQTRIRRRGQAAVRGPHAHGPGGREIAESRRHGRAGTGTPSMADARRELGSLFGFEGVGPGQSRFQAALRLAGVAADGTPSGNAWGVQRGHVVGAARRRARHGRRTLPSPASW